MLRGNGGSTLIFVTLVYEETHMRTTNVRFAGLALGCAVLGGLVALPLTSRTARADRELRNPRIHHAIEALRDAEIELKEAPHDFHGEKREAMEAVHNAIEHLDRIREW